MYIYAQPPDFLFYFILFFKYECAPFGYIYETYGVTVLIHARYASVNSFRLDQYERKHVRIYHHDDL